jgi:hypothetical protein
MEAMRSRPGIAAAGCADLSGMSLTLVLRLAPAVLRREFILGSISQKVLHAVKDKSVLIVS